MECYILNKYLHHNHFGGKKFKKFILNVWNGYDKDFLQYQHTHTSCAF